MPVLDGVRGLAILMVFAVHFVGDAVVTNRVEAFIGAVAVYGMYGVDLFFVLSGFLITGILIDSKADPGYFRNFYMRRTLRIFPLYYGVLAMVFLVAPAVPFLRGTALDGLRHDQAWAWCYGMNILAALRGKIGTNYLDHFWSLAVEEHFYLFWPAVVWLCPTRKLARVAAGASLTSIVARIALAGHVNPVAIYTLTPFRLDALCMGACLAALARTHGVDAIARSLRPTALGAAATFVACSAMAHTFPEPASEALRQLRITSLVVLLAVGLMTTLVVPKQSAVARFFTSHTMRLLGRYSYGLYVFHQFISFYFVRNRTEFVLAERLGSHWLAVAVQAVGGIAGSLLLAVTSYHVYERPFIAMKRFWALRVPPETVGAPSTTEIRARPGSPVITASDRPRSSPS
jgi:peptidoglycan/LPS O-acetylase OafA/YrhL